MMDGIGVGESVSVYVTRNNSFALSGEMYVLFFIVIIILAYGIIKIINDKIIGE